MTTSRTRETTPTRLLKICGETKLFECRGHFRMTRNTITDSSTVLSVQVYARLLYHNTPTFFIQLWLCKQQGVTCRPTRCETKSALPRHGHGFKNRKELHRLLLLLPKIRISNKHGPRLYICSVGSAVGVYLSLRDVHDTHTDVRATLSDHRHGRPADVPGSHAADVVLKLLGTHGFRD